MIDAGRLTLNLPRCRHCGESFMSWWPRNLHEETCPVRALQRLEARADAERAAQKAHEMAVSVRKREKAETVRQARELAARQRAKERKQRLRLVPRTIAGNRRTPKKRPVVLACRKCRSRHCVVWNGDGRGHVTAVLCLDCRYIGRKIPRKDSGCHDEIVVE